MSGRAVLRPLDLVWNMPCEPIWSASLLKQQGPQLAPKLVRFQCLLLTAQDRLIREILEWFTTTSQTIESDDFFRLIQANQTTWPDDFFQGKNRLKDEKNRMKIFSEDRGTLLRAGCTDASISNFSYCLSKSRTAVSARFGYGVRALLLSSTSRLVAESKTRKS